MRKLTVLTSSNFRIFFIIFITLVLRGNIIGGDPQLPQLPHVTEASRARETLRKLNYSRTSREASGP